MCLTWRIAALALIDLAGVIVMVTSRGSWLQAGMGAALVLTTALLAALLVSREREVKAQRTARELEATNKQRADAFNRFYYHGVLIDPINKDALYAIFKTEYDPGEPVSDAVRYQMMKAVGGLTLPTAVREILAPRDEEAKAYQWPDGSWVTSKQTHEYYPSLLRGY